NYGRKQLGVFNGVPRAPAGSPWSVVLGLTGEHPRRRCQDSSLSLLIPVQVPTCGACQGLPGLRLKSMQLGMRNERLGGPHRRSPTASRRVRLEHATKVLRVVDWIVDVATRRSAIEIRSVLVVSPSNRTATQHA